MQHKFRAWDRIDKVMYPAKEISFVYELIAVKKANEKTGSDETDDVLDFDNADLLQFTNFYAGGIETPENEIYDGHILGWINTFGKISKGAVRYNQEFGKWVVEDKDGFQNLWVLFRKAKILGSIQENPELMNAC